MNAPTLKLTRDEANHLLHALEELKSDVDETETPLYDKLIKEYLRLRDEGYPAAKEATQ